MKRIGRLILVLGVVVTFNGCGQPRQKTQEQARDRSLQARVSEISQASEEPAKDVSEDEGPAVQPVKYQKVREPAVAGMFYALDREKLAENVDELLAEVKPAPIKNLRGLICPHAGYPCSGKTAAIAYKQLVGRDVRTVIVMAPSHYASFEGASIPAVDAYRTPLGDVPLSPKAKELSKISPLVGKPSCEVRRPDWWRRSPKQLPPFGEDTPHSWEHSLEVQLPFLQRTLKDFALVPIVFGEVDPEAAAAVLVKHLDDKTLLVASSDLSHFHPYEQATNLDTLCVKAICSLNTAWAGQQEACGKLPILTLMHIARQKHWKARLLDYRNSGDTTGDKSGVVGYAAIAFYVPDKTETPRQTGQSSYSPKERKFLLELARKTVVDYVTDAQIPTVDEAKVPENLTEMKACFVTLTKGGRLRGCIGGFFPRAPLYQEVIQMAVSAATRDRRFPLVEPKELDQIRIEISVLTVPERLKFDSPEQLLAKLRPHVDGVILQVRSRQSTYLPQVWEKLPDKETFLGHLAEKAGLPSSAWRSPQAAVLTYQVEAFQESGVRIQD